MTRSLSASLTSTLVISGTFLLAACAGNTVIVEPEPAPTTVVPEQQRITDDAIRRDRQYIQSLQDRIAFLTESGVRSEDYNLCKAQAWLDLAFNEYIDNDRTGVVEAALSESVAIIDKMEAGVEVPTDTPIINTSSRVRDDLWKTVADSKLGGEGACMSCATAKLEVQLVWIGHEQGELGYRHGIPESQIAERYARMVNAGEVGCMRIAGLPVERPVPMPVFQLDRNLPLMPRFVHFALDSADIGDKSIPVIAQIAEKLTEYSNLKVRLEGHTDLRGMTAYNLDLARDRVKAVRVALINAGVDPSRLEMTAIGAAKPRAGGGDLESHAKNRRVELVIVDGNEMQLEPQEKDLQIENPNATIANRR